MAERSKGIAAGSGVDIVIDEPPFPSAAKYVPGDELHDSSRLHQERGSDRARFGRKLPEVSTVIRDPINRIPGVDFQPFVHYARGRVIASQGEILLITSLIGGEIRKSLIVNHWNGDGCGERIVRAGRYRSITG